MDRDNSLQFEVILNTEGYVQEKANEISEGTEFFDETRKCHARFVVIIENLDSVLH